MTAARLEELAQWAENEQREQRFDGSLQRDQDYADLARCARAWAKVERAMQRSTHGVEIFGYKGRALPWAYLPSDLLTDRYAGPTAIEAVEAAEVKR